MTNPLCLPVGVGNRTRARRSTDEEEDAEHDDESVEQGGGDQVLTRRSVDLGEEEERSDESVGEVDTEDEADGDELPFSSATGNASQCHATQPT